MTNKEKIIAYDEAIKRAEAAIKVAQNQKDVYNCIITIFPELKKSKDEEIRKELIDFFQDWHKIKPSRLSVNVSDILAWLEKQGQQEEPQVYETEDGEIITYSESEGYKVLEPKFNIGDWVVYNRNDSSREILYVYDIRDGRYYFNDNIHFSWSVKECDEKCHLWTIDDAKDGDILASDNSIFIFQEDYIAEKPIAYCGLMNGCFIVEEEDAFWINEKCYPATKEQRDTLFAKMREAEYEWNAEKKELKEIHVIDEGKDEMDYCFTKMMNGEKVSSVWNEEDEWMFKQILQQFITANNDCKLHNASFTYDQEILFLKSLKYRVQSQPKKEWSKEDNKIIEEIINDIECARAINYHAPKEGYEFRENWLKSLKDRVQSKKEWSKEDIYTIENIDSVLFYDKKLPEDTRMRCRNWLKLLKPQNKWKPSDDQMKALDDALSLAKNCGEEMAFDLRTLYEQLKKLR